jgi:hypothetical protein
VSGNTSVPPGEQNSLQAIDANGYVINADTMVLEVKEELLSQFKRTGVLPETATVEWLRLWEKLGTSKGKLLKYNDKSLGENGFVVSDWRHMYVQLLDADPTSAVCEADVLMLVQRWHRNTWTTSPVIEVSISCDMLVTSLFDALALMSGISVVNLQVLALFSFTEVPLCALDDEFFLSTKSSRWLQKPEEGSRQQTVFEWYAHITQGYSKADAADGTLLLLKDSCEPLRELNTYEKSSQKRALEGDSYFTPGLFNPSYSAVGSSSYIHRPLPRSERGIKIKTRSEKEAEDNNRDSTVSPYSPEPTSKSLHNNVVNDSSNFDIL